MKFSRCFGIFNTWARIFQSNLCVRKLTKYSKSTFCPKTSELTEIWPRNVPKIAQKYLQNPTLAMTNFKILMPHGDSRQGYMDHPNWSGPGIEDFR